MSEFIRFQPFWRWDPFPSGDHLRIAVQFMVISGPGIICGRICGSFAVLGSFVGLHSVIRELFDPSCDILPVYS